MNNHEHDECHGRSIPAPVPVLVPFVQYEDHSSLSSPSSSSPSSAKVVKEKYCVVCGGKALNKHFGVMCCTACSSFFRRTLAFRKTYSCTGKTCDIFKLNKRYMCKFCRFRRCVFLGMDLYGILPKEVSEGCADSEKNSAIRSILLAQRETFVERFASTMKLANGKSELVSLGRTNPSFDQCALSAVAEFGVLQSYLKNSGFKEMGLSQQNLHTLSFSVFYDWISYQTIVSTLRNSGHQLNMVCFPDECSLTGNYDIMLRYYSSCEYIMNPKIVTEYGQKCFLYCIDSSKKLHSNHLDEIELILIFQIFALKTAAKMFPHNVEITKNLQKTFQFLEKHYDNSYDNVALRMGNVVLSIEVIQNFTKFFGEYVAILDINGYDTVKSKVLGNASQL